MIKRQFGLMKVRFRGLAKNTAYVVTVCPIESVDGSTPIIVDGALSESKEGGKKRWSA